ncbi:MAG TPA: BamA/TamA family outer membrane protein [Steroidobacteraceae bacterium]|jgi:translocation and assembly module TamA
MPWIHRKLLLFGALLALSASAWSADPQSYKVDFATTGNHDIDTTIKATSDLQSLRSSAPVSPFGLIARARSDLDRLTTAIESYGYYQSTITIRINGILLSDPGLGDALTALPKGSTAQVGVNFKLGPLYNIRRIDIDGKVPPPLDARATLGLQSGQPAVAANILAGGARLLNALEEEGYAFAKVDPPIAYEAADAPVLDLTFHLDAGAKVNLGQIHIEGLKRVHESLLRKRLLLHTGDPFSPSAVEHARQDLLGLGVFAQVSVQIGDKADASGGVPLTIKIRERARHAVAVNALYSSDLGGSGGVTWTDRNVFGNAEQLQLKAEITNFGGSDTNGVGYDLGARYSLPDFLHRDQSLLFSVEAQKLELQAYDQTSRSVGVTLLRKLSSIFSVSAGILATDDHIVQPPDVVENGSTPCKTHINTNPPVNYPGCEQIPQTFNYTLIALPFNVNYDSTHLSSPLVDPTHGFRASVSLAPTLAIGHPTTTFLITQLKAAGYFDLKGIFNESAGRSVLALRTLIGQALGASEFSLPPDQRFYGGGSGTIRGFGYQKVGPTFANDPNFPTGGTAITAAGAEFRQRFYSDWGAAVFLDAGQVSAKLKFLPDQLRVGAGAGVRYYTPIGPIRFDVAVPVPRRAGDDAFEIYIGLGQTF